MEITIRLFFNFVNLICILKLCGNETVSFEVFESIKISDQLNADFPF